MKKAFCLGAFVAAFMAFDAASGWSQLLIDFEGTYFMGVYTGWKQGTDGWGDPPEPFEATPGQPISGSAQGLKAIDGSHYVLTTLGGFNPGSQYQISVWIRTLQYGGAQATPNGWVEFGWDPEGRDTTQPNGDPLTWCVDPKLDYANNVARWIQYTGEAFTATGPLVTIAFKVGSTGGVGVQAHFDNLTIQPAGQGEIYEFPDDFNTTYTLGAHWGWNKRFIPGGDSPHWAEAGGEDGGSAQRLYAGVEGTTLAVDIGVAKVFYVVRNRPYRLRVWVYGSDSYGNALTNPNGDVGPIIAIGQDLTSQNTEPLAASIAWDTAPTAYFTRAGYQNSWHEFTLPVMTPPGDFISVWLWVKGDDDIGVDARFDTLTYEPIADVVQDAKRWHLYQ